MRKILCFLLIIMSIVSCQKEEKEFIDPNEDNRIPKDSQLANLMKNMVIHDGSFDDIVDNANCFSINIPYTIMLGGNEREINGISDYQGISNIDVVEIKYPVTITLADHTQRVIRNDSELSTFGDSCRNEDDDDIECIDFVYPIQLSTFNSRSNIMSSVKIDHDANMFNFMENVDENVSVSINYPISLLLHNGQNIGAQHNSELLSNILRVASACDENDTR
ncbi:hypothetical protein [Aquimarina aggregata]|nr:hypothetical protein [Aquimarina aggregata]